MWISTRLSSTRRPRSLLLADSWPGRVRNTKSDVCASRGRDNVGRATVSRCNRRDDRQAKAGSAAAPTLLCSAEALESMRCEARREARSVVCDVELDRVPPLLGADPNRARSVSEGVLDEIAECLLHSEAIDSNLDVRRADLEPAASISCAPVEAGRDAFEQLVDGDHAESQRQLPFVGAGEEQEIRGELRQSVGFDPHLAQRSLELCAGARGLERELDFGLDVGERGPQLIARLRG